MGLVKGVHHLPICTSDIKTQLDFFTDVLGCELKALYWMHGAENTLHAFLHLGGQSHIAFVYNVKKPAAQPEPGLTHPKRLVSMSADGTMHHTALSVESEADLLAMRDRIRSKGVNVFGPIDHGFCESIYFAGPDRLNLEISTSAAPIDDRAWIDPEVVDLVGISAAELAGYRAPEPYENTTGAPVPNPPIDPERPTLPMPPDVYRRIMTMSDDEVARTMDESEPPVTV